MDFIPESRLVHSVVTACVVMSQLYFLAKYHKANRIYLVKSAQKRADGDELGKRCDGSSSREQPVGKMLIKEKSSLPNIDGLLKFAYACSVLTNVYLALKYFVLCLLDSKTMRNYRYLDCFLIGRTSINGRTTGLAKYIGLCLPIFQLGWRFTMLYVRPNFSLIYMEFLLRNPNELIVREAEAHRRNRLRGRARSITATIESATEEAKVFILHHAQLHSRRQNGSEKQYSTLMNYSNPFVEVGSLSGAHGNFTRLRPNRTFRAWSWASSVLLLYLVVTIGPALVGLVPALRMFLPLILTRPGFRLNYYNCVDWISRQSNKQDYSFIDTTAHNETGALLSLARAFMPLDDYIEPNVYHTLRLGADISENLFIFLEAAISFIIYTSVSVVCAADMYFYTETINRRVKEMIYTMRSDRCLSREASMNLADGLNSVVKVKRDKLNEVEARFELDHRLKANRDYDAQILDIQAMVVDMFALIGAYNSYAAFFTMYSLAIWFAYSAVCSVPWIFVPLMAESSKLEWYLLEAISTVIIFIIIGFLNSVRRSTHKLYQSLATLATLDHTRHWAKNDRWLGLLKHYSPIPLYCFTISRTSDVSWLLGLKMFAWLASALFVTSSFLVRATERKA